MIVKGRGSSEGRGRVGTGGSDEKSGMSVKERATGVRFPCCFRKARAAGQCQMSMSWCSAKKYCRVVLHVRLSSAVIMANIPTAPFSFKHFAIDGMSGTTCMSNTDHAFPCVQLLQDLSHKTVQGTAGFMLHFSERVQRRNSYHFQD